MHLLNVKLLGIFFWDSSNWALKHSGSCIQFSNYNDNKVRSQKKKTTLFGNFSQTPDPPPTPPFWEPLIQKKILVFILHFRT